MDPAAQRIDDETVDVGELLQRRQVAGEGQVAEHHLVTRVLTTGPVLGEAFGPPERKLHVPCPGRLVVGLGLKAQLKDVGEFVAERVAELGQASPERQGDAALEEIGGAKQPLGRRERQDIGLLEVDVRGVDDERNPDADIVPELERQGVVARLGIGQRDGREIRFRGVVVQVDVRALQYAPVEPAVLDLVLVEGEELGRRAPERQERRASRQRESRPLHVGLTCESCESDHPE